jgi:ubiquinone/menaquinone biosynthesis C-methylase UbiE
MQVEWVYSELAAFYDKRADYSAAALDRLLQETGVAKGARVADIGAGTAKLALPLARRGFIVDAVEPNDEMRSFGIRNTSGQRVTWHDGTGEITGLPVATFELATFGSSFNVVDQAKALKEVARILKPSGWVACMWNHRDLGEPVQAAIEGIIHAEIPSYQYGARRQDPTDVIAESRLYSSARFIEDRFVAQVPKEDYLDAYRSHATLQRQAGAKFSTIIAKMAESLQDRPILEVPYFTRIWFARLL